MENIYRGIEVYRSYTYGTWGEINKILLILQFIVFCILPIVLGITIFIMSQKKHIRYLLGVGLLLITIGIGLPIYILYQAGQSSYEKEAQQKTQLEMEAQAKKQKDEIVSNMFMNNSNDYYVLPDSFTNNGYIYSVSDRFFENEGYFEDKLTSIYSNDGDQSGITLRDSLLTNKSYRQVRCSEAMTLPCREISSVLGTMTCTDWPDRLDCKLDMENGRQLWFLIYNPKTAINEQELLDSVLIKKSTEIKLL